MATLNMKASKGFTLIELLVVIAIIGILAAITLSALDSARSRARDAQLLRDARDVGLAVMMWANDKGDFAQTFVDEECGRWDTNPTSPNYGGGEVFLNSSNPNFGHLFFDRGVVQCLIDEGYLSSSVYDRYYSEVNRDNSYSPSLWKMMCPDGTFEIMIQFEYAPMGGSEYCGTPGVDRHQYNQGILKF